jgi:membrane-associated protease RseP (regulator of RpoE activity)
MENQRTIQVLRSLGDHEMRTPGEPALLKVPGQWAYALASLIKISNEHRHNGVIVTNIGPDSPGANAGMVRGDVLLRYDGVEIDCVETLRRLQKRHTQDGDVSKTVSIDAARGSTDLSFEVAAGRLGITASPPLHRLKIHLASRTQPRQFELMLLRGQQEITVIQTPADARMHETSKPAFVEIPKELTKKVLSLLKSLEASGGSELKKMARSLLSSARA